ncbi:hypothetical protein HYQ45_016138 [Verticillium longisporum]
MPLKPPDEAILAQAHIAPDTFDLAPSYRALLLTASNIAPGPSDPHSESLLLAAEASARAATAGDTPVTDRPHIVAWRATYKAFGAKPNRTRNSLEALTRRAAADGGGLPRVNRLTDVYNAVSVRCQMPLGGEDLDRYDGAPFLTRAAGTEVLKALSPDVKTAQRIIRGPASE